MNKKRNWARYLVWLVIIIVVALGLLRAERTPPASQGSGASHGPLATINPKMKSVFATVAAQHLKIGARTASADCQVNGPLPDANCTPGAIFPDATTSTICVAGYSAKVRYVTASTKKKVYAEYGFSYPQATGAFEADHLVPLELGGSNDIANLWPEAASPTPGFHEKDIVENYLNEEVCNGNINLKMAQTLDAVNWLVIYNSLSPEEIAALKNQWAEN